MIILTDKFKKRLCINMYKLYVEDHLFNGKLIYDFYEKFIEQKPESYKRRIRTHIQYYRNRFIKPTPDRI